MELEKIQSIDLVFENCEVAKLLPNMFDSLVIEGITENYLINCYQYKNGEVRKNLRCKEFMISINKKGLAQKMDNEYTLNERLDRYKDLTHIDLIFLKRNEYITLPWQGENSENEKQIHRKFKDGLSIVLAQ